MRNFRIDFFLLAIGTEVEPNDISIIIILKINTVLNKYLAYPH